MSEIINQHPGIYQTGLVSRRFIVNLHTFVITSVRYGALWNHGAWLMVNVNGIRQFPFLLHIHQCFNAPKAHQHAHSRFLQSGLALMFIYYDTGFLPVKQLLWVLIVVPNKWMWMNECMIEFKKFCELSEQCVCVCGGVLLLTFLRGIPVTTRKCRLTASPSN